MAIATVDDIKKKFGWDEDRTKKYLNDILKAALANRQGNKENRPWNIVDFREKLDANQPWIGFEFETGFDDIGEYKKFINMLWQQDYTAIDREGTGQYPVEVAFAPMHAADVLAGKSTLEQAVKFIYDEGLTPALNPTTFTMRDVGIHAGVSTPKFRALNYNDKASVVRRLDEILTSPTATQRKKLYNRSALLWGGAWSRNNYVEIKTFKAVPTLEAVQKYIRVTGQIVKLLDMLIDDKDLALTSNQAFNFLSSDTDKVA